MVNLPITQYAVIAQVGDKLTTVGGFNLLDEANKAAKEHALANDCPALVLCAREEFAPPSKEARSVWQAEDVKNAKGAIP
jgi:hypothetical protein